MDLAQEIREFCRKYLLRLNTDLGQHFLTDQNILDQIIEAANIEKDDHIVEIGPGIGVLTRELLKKTENVTAIEIDDRLIPILETFVEDKISAVQGNALKQTMPDHPYKIVANIPYHITSPLLRHVFLESEVIPTSMTLLIQREVAEKICSEKDAGLLTILVKLFGTPRIVTTVPPKAFLPPPKVDSAVIHIDCFEKPIADKETIEEIFRLTKIAFGQKRKMLRKTIGSLDGGMEMLEKAGIDGTRRPQTLSIEEWKKLAQK